MQGLKKINFILRINSDNPFLIILIRKKIKILDKFFIKLSLSNFLMKFKASKNILEKT